MSVISRRRLVQWGLSGLALGAASHTSALTTQVVTQREKKIALHNLHTGERLRAVFWQDGQYVQETVSELNYLLRDHRADTFTTMDLQLLESMHKLAILNEAEELHIISGYRSPETNEKLRQQGRGVAKKSLHMQGRAIDLRIPGRSLSKVYQSALSFHHGGIGYYGKSQFIHLDTGRNRRW
ncbi:YcbK family protein [Aurantivibrio plasticivorans]